jgi:hypothetical protein
MNGPVVSSAVARLLALTLLAFGGSTLAWKPITHTYLAEEALRDAQDGSVTIPVLVNGQPQNPPVEQSYQVDPALLSAIQNNTGQYRAGVLGPDAYPDIMTGQQVIHPPSDRDTPTTHLGSNEWLEHLWDSSRAESPAVKAFVAGYLTHAAGDLFAHAFINYYAGGAFTISPVQNAVKHLVLEGYVGKRTPILHKYNDPSSPISSGTFGPKPSSSQPAPFFPSNDINISGVETFIYDKMINIVPGSPLANLYSGRVSAASIPFLYSKTREGLQQHINWYYSEKQNLEARVRRCWTPWCYSKYGLLLLVHTTVIWETRDYAGRWQEDIDEGLKLWPSISHQLAAQLIYPSADGDPANAGITGDRLAEADRVASDYFWNHMVSMTGFPDQTGPVARWALNFMGSLIPSWPWYTEMKRRLINQMVKNATGKEIDDWKQYVSNPEQYFDSVMTAPAAHTITLQQMNQDVLHLPPMTNGLPDPGYQEASLRFAIDTLPPAYNTLIMSKLVLLSQPELARFAQNLPYSNTPDHPAPTAPEIAAATQRNAVLGFIDSLDGNSEPNVNERDKSVIFGNCGAYNAVFKPQLGDERCTRSPLPLPGTPTNFEATAESDTLVSLHWDAVPGADQYRLQKRTNNGAFSAGFLISDTFYTDTGVRARTRYTYRLQAVNADGASLGVDAEVTTPDPPPCESLSERAARAAKKSVDAPPSSLRPLPPC